MIIQRIQTKWSKIPTLWAFIGYLLLSVASCFPLIFHLKDFPSDSLPSGDIGQYFWDFWWTLHQIESWDSIYECDFLFYPVGVNLTFYTLHLFNTLFVLPFQMMGIPQVGYNLFLMASGALSGLGIYLLCKDLKVETRASWIAGALFLLAPYRYGQLDHFNLINTVPIPFYLLWMRRGILGKSWKAPILWGLWLFLTANTAWYYLFFLLILSPFWLFHVSYQLGIKEHWKKILIRTGIAMLVFFLLFLPQLILILRSYEATEHKRPIEVIAYWSADLSHFVIPPFIGKKIAAGWGPSYYPLTGEGEFAVFPGIVLWLLVIGCLYRYRKARGKFWVGIALLGGILALGPLLKIVDFLPQDYGSPPLVYLPGYLVLKIPVLGAMRTVARWSLIFQLGLILFVAFNFNRIELSLKQKIRLPIGILAVLVLLLTFVENRPGPFPHSSQIPPEIFSRLSENLPDKSVLHLPLGGPKEEGFYMYLQTLHGLPICNGYTPFRPRPEHLLKYPLIALLEKQALQKPDPDILRQNLEDLDIGWILLHPPFYKDLNDLLWLDEILTKQLGGINFYRDKEFWIYKYP